jgi:hypothetical protein
LDSSWWGASASWFIVFVAGGPVGFFIGKAFGVGADPAGGLTKTAGWTMPGGLTGPLPVQAVGADQAAHGTPDSEHQPAVGVGTGGVPGEDASGDRPAMVNSTKFWSNS